MIEKSEQGWHFCFHKYVCKTAREIEWVMEYMVLSGHAWCKWVIIFKDLFTDIKESSRKKNVEAAVEVGIVGLRFKNADKLREDLSLAGIDV